MISLTSVQSMANIPLHLQKTGVEFGDSFSQGTTAMCQFGHGFFYALTVLVGGVLGSLRTGRFLDPVRQPDTSPAALSLATSDGRLKTTVKESIMHILKTPNKSVSAQSRFNVVTRSGRSLARYVPFNQAIRLKASHPDSLIKFAGMEGRV